jgi:hypothetical protein
MTLNIKCNAFLIKQSDCENDWGTDSIYSCRNWQKSHFRVKYSDSGPPEYEEKCPTSHGFATHHKSKDICVTVEGTWPSAAVTVTCFSNTDIITTHGEKTMGCCRLPACASAPQANLALCADRPTCRCYRHSAAVLWRPARQWVRVRNAIRCRMRQPPLVTPFRQSREGKHPPYSQ